MTDPLFYVRAVHFAASVAAAGVVFFIVFIAGPASRHAKGRAQVAKALRIRLAVIAWIGLAAALLSGVPWLVLVAESMSGQPLGSLASQGVLWTVLSQTTFGSDWLLRFALACALGGLFVHLLSPTATTTSRWLKTLAVIVAAAFVGTLAWAGHAIGGQGAEGIFHPAADVVHLIAAATWVGALVPLALLLGMTAEHEFAVVREATLRFSTLGIVSVAALLLTGIVNTWYLVGSFQALIGTDYGRLLLIKIALFLGMVGIAGVNRTWLAPRLVRSADTPAAQNARRRLCHNAVIEAAMGAAVIVIVAVLGTLPPASHSHHHASEGMIPADAAFQHIHGEDGMADVMIEPGRVGMTRATIHLWNDDLETLDARDVMLTLTAPPAGSKPITRAASQDADGAWHVNGIKLTEPGDWTVKIGAVLGNGKRLNLEAPIAIEGQ